MATPENNQNQPVQYDPEKHAGLLHVGGHNIIVSDASQAKLHELPLDVRKAIAKDTCAQLAVMDFSRGVGGAIIQITDEARAEKEEQGYQKGLKLLHLPSGWSREK